MRFKGSYQLRLARDKATSSEHAVPSFGVVLIGFLWGHLLGTCWSH